MTGVQTCALPICFPVTINGVRVLIVHIWLHNPFDTLKTESKIYQEIHDFPLLPERLAEIVELVESGILTHNLASHQLFPLAVAQPSLSAKAIVEKEGWLANKPDADSLQQHIDQTLSSFPEKVKEYHGGKKGLLAMFIGDVMKKTKGTADPKKLNQLMSEALEKLK